MYGNTLLEKYLCPDINSPITAKFANKVFRFSSGSRVRKFAAREMMSAGCEDGMVHF